MKKHFSHFFPFRWIVTALVAVSLLYACDASEETISDSVTSATEAIVLVIDEESIDNGNEPNNFSEKDVNDQLADIGLRLPLKFFEKNVGKEIEFYTGEVGDEGWFALKTIPSSWISAGPTLSGVQNYLTPGPGLGAPDQDDDREILLDKIPDVTPLRATGLKMLIGHTILAVVYDSEVSINYSPLLGSLKGDNLGLVALEVVDVIKREDGSSGSLPKVRVIVHGINPVGALPLFLFSNAPVPSSSSEPFDITPPAVVPALIPAAAP